MKSVSSIIIIAIVSLIIMWGCSYSFTGSSVPPHLKTIAIPTVKDKSNSGEPNLSNDLTQTLTQEFINDNSLYVVNSTTADAILTVTVLSLQDRAEVVSGEKEKASDRRITLRAKAVYKDLVMKKTIFEKDFSNYGIFKTDNYVENRQTAIQDAIDNVALDLLLAVVADW
ncbi:MAG: LptE family protein [Bacteroidota bacterium]